MKNVIKYFLIILSSIIIGCGVMYGVIYFFPNLVVNTITKEETVVNVVDDGIAAGIKNVYDSVVVVEAYSKDTLVSIGSGFAYKTVSGDTYLMTNHHVINGCDKIIVTLSNTTELEAQIVGSDAYADIAVLKVNNNDGLKISTIGNVDDMQVGDTVFAVGSPMGKTYANTVTRGILSGKDRMVETAVNNSSISDWIMNVMQTDAAINPGNSGGPLCNASGEVIGINSMKIVESSVEGLGFAIPIDDAVTYADSISENGKIIRGYIGIEMINATEKFQLLRNGIKLDDKVKDGVVVGEVIENSPASKTDLKLGDVIVKMNGEDITNIAEFRYNLYKYTVGTKISLTVYRNGKTIDIDVVIGSSQE